MEGVNAKVVQLSNTLAQPQTYGADFKCAGRAGGAGHGACGQGREECGEGVYLFTHTWRLQVVRGHLRLSWAGGLLHTTTTITFKTLQRWAPCYPPMCMHVWFARWVKRTHPLACLPLWVDYLVVTAAIIC